MDPSSFVRTVERRRTAFTTLTVLADMAVLAAALLAGYAASFPDEPLRTFPLRQGKLLALVLVLFPALFALQGGYTGNATGSFRRRLAPGVFTGIAGSLAVFATLFLFRNTYYQRGALTTFFVVLPAMILAARTALLLLRAPLLRNNRLLLPADLVTIGAQEDLVAPLRSVPPSPVRLSPHQGGAAPCTMIAAADALLPDAAAAAATAAAGGAQVRLLDPLVRRTLERVEDYDGSGVVAAGPVHRILPRLQSALARGIDLALAGTALVLTAPLFAAIALAVRLDSAGPVFFRQRRSLRPEGPAIEVLKFRTMRFDPEEDRPPEIPRRGKAADDRRVTAVGRILRRLSLDELPQLANVVRGEMALVGPRPLPAADFAGILPGSTAALLAARRGETRPGLTGLWQTAGRSTLGLDEMLILDAWHAEHRTVLSDLRILLRTVPSVLSGHGAF